MTATSILPPCSKSFLDKDAWPLLEVQQLPQPPPVISPDGRFWWDGEQWQPYNSPAPQPSRKSDRWCDNCEQLVTPRASWAPFFYTLLLNIVGVAVAAFVAVLVASVALQGNDIGEFTFATIIAGLILMGILTVLRPGVRFECPICESEFTKHGMSGRDVRHVSGFPRTRPRRRRRGWLVLVLVAELAAALAVYGYFNPFPVINPPTTWNTPSDAQLGGWQQEVQEITASTGGFLNTGLFNHQVGEGSGFFVGPGVLITALHVVTGDGLDNTVFWNDGSSDLSLADEATGEDAAALSGASGPTFSVATARPARGQHAWLLCATGVNNGIEVSEFTVANPSVSAELSGAPGTPTHYVQDEIAMTGGAVAPGCSGSPVVDGSGAVVGMADGGECGSGGTCQLDAVPSEVFAQWVSPG